MVGEEVSISEDYTDILHGNSFCLFSLLIINENKTKCKGGR